MRVCQQVNHPKTRWKSLNWFQRKKTKVPVYLSYSSDSNPMENLWKEFMIKLCQRGLQSFQCLK
uniref:Tc1-like transposase DDE domain-containing protein n=1 Tax=Poecilia mexicana TaxID=48701 RepID=A0A3B3Y4V3_9TELE